VLRVRVSWGSVTNGPGLSTFYFTGTDQTAADNAALAVRAFMNSLEATYPSYGTWELQPTVAKIDTSNGDLIGLFAVTTESGVGSNASEQLPIQTQGLLEMHTGQIVFGRELRGRLFVPGPTETESTNGAPTSTYRTALESAANTLRTDPNSEWLVWSRTHGIAYPVTTAVCWTKWAVQRGRRD
jgi:hypothetical protein